MTLKRSRKISKKRSRKISKKHSRARVSKKGGLWPFNSEEEKCRKNSTTMWNAGQKKCIEFKLDRPVGPHREGNAHFINKGPQTNNEKEADKKIVNKIEKLSDRNKDNKIKEFNLQEKIRCEQAAKNHPTRWDSSTKLCKEQEKYNGYKIDPLRLLKLREDEILRNFCTRDNYMYSIRQNPWSDNYMCLMQGVNPKTNKMSENEFFENELYAKFPELSRMNYTTFLEQATPDKIKEFDAMIDRLILMRELFDKIQNLTQYLFGISEEKYMEAFEELKKITSLKDSEILDFISDQKLKSKYKILYK
jgi:uncharacterized short protein YbdD (DUF466 family)